MKNAVPETCIHAKVLSQSVKRFPSFASACRRTACVVNAMAAGLRPRGAFAASGMRGCLRAVLNVACVAALVLLAALGCAGAASSNGRVAGATATSGSGASGYYTLQQAKAGEALFSQHCSNCHGTNLEGLSGPPLAGEVFKNDVKFNNITAAQLFGFIATQMPYDNPGRLSKDQYELIFSYILYRNHYPSGPTPFSSNALDKVKLLPFPSAEGK